MSVRKNIYFDEEEYSKLQEIKKSYGFSPIASLQILQKRSLKNLKKII